MIGFFNNTQTKYVNVSVSKSSPNRIGTVIEIVRWNKHERFAIVQFRDFRENISLKTETPIAN